MTEKELQDIIGLKAGEIWHYINQNGPTTTLKLKSSLNISNTILYLSLGWLQREDKIKMSQSGYTFVISLK